MIHNEPVKVGISIGDMNGIGLEVILKTFEDSRILEVCMPIIFASNKIISFQKKHFNITGNFNGINNIKNAIEGKLNVMNCWKDPFNITFGESTEEGGKFALLSLESAVKSLKDNEIDVLVTAPINKNNIQSKDFKFPGHTDYLNQELEGNSLMFMVSEGLRVGLLTDHVPVKDISAMITEDLIRRKVNIINNSLKMDFRINKPRIAILGLNPHCGDHGVIGQEDDTIIAPTIQKLFQEGILVFGPYSADGFFASGQAQKFDAVIAPYHDQGLIPFKTLSFGTGVNYTAGLNKIRTSPDHGTAYEIAGKNIADCSSFREAVFTAVDIFRNRNEYQELTSNVLEISDEKTRR